MLEEVTVSQVRCDVCLKLLDNEGTYIPDASGIA
jgi:hypothetical protein